LAHPPVDPATADADVHRILVGSGLFAKAGFLGSTLSRAWTCSRTFDVVERWRLEVPKPLAERIRWFARCTLVAALTALVLLLAARSGRREFQALLPLAVAVLAAAAVRGADAIARAWTGKHA